MKSNIQQLFKKHGTHLFNLKDRWAEEKEFEDIADYGKEIAKIFKRFKFFFNIMLSPQGGTHQTQNNNQPKIIQLTQFNRAIYRSNIS